METIPWYQSAILRQQIVQFISAASLLFGVNLAGLDLDATVVNIFGGIAAVVAIWTFVTRLIKPAPNLTQAAANKEVQLVLDKTIPPSPTGPGSQRGFASVKLLGVVGLVALALGSLAACTGTRAAYKEAQASPDALYATAYVFAENYNAWQKEALVLASKPGTPRAVIDLMQKADREATPVIIGDAGKNRPGLLELARTYKAVRSAENEAALTAAIDQAAQALARFINAVKSARS